MFRNRKVRHLTAASCAVLASLFTTAAQAVTTDPNLPRSLAAALPVETAPLDNTYVTAGDVPLVIDNDEEKLQAETEYTWKEIPDGPNKTHISAGARFPVEVVADISSKTAKVGDPIEARLRIDLKVGGKVVAHKGCRVIGHVSSVEPARKMIVAEFNVKNRWMRQSGAIGIQFDEIINEKGEHLPLVACPAVQARIVKNLSEGRVLGVNTQGQLCSPLSTQLKSQAIHMAIRIGASAGGIFSMGIVPAAYATAGAISPSFAFMKPVGKNVRHRRLKGAAIGFVAGLPGGFLISDSIIRGNEAIIHPGDIFEAEFRQDFTGEAATDAQLMPGAKTKVHGEVIPKDSK